ncbi:MAG: GNAT family N-acetyltransferase [Rhizobiaceae bacterium]
MLALDGASRAAALDLNNRFAAELSRADRDRFDWLADNAYLAARIGMVRAFLIAFDQDAAYDSPNFLWCRNRARRFVYVDRVVTDPDWRGHGLARALYAHLLRRAVADGHDTILCEVNLVPPNPASDAFHAALGFVEVGRAGIFDGAKTVRYLELRLPVADGNPRNNG